jgi:DNA polymerase V
LSKPTVFVWPQYCAARAARLPVATADTARLIHGALAGLSSLWRSGFRYNKAGVVLLELHSPGHLQPGLFDAPDTPRRVTLMRTVDALNRQYGRNTVTFAVSGQRQAWRLKSDQLSPPVHNTMGGFIAGLRLRRFRC